MYGTAILVSFLCLQLTWSRLGVIWWGLVWPYAQSIEMGKLGGAKRGKLFLDLLGLRLMQELIDQVTA